MKQIPISLNQTNIRIQKILYNKGGLIMDKDFMSEEEKKEKQGYLLLQKALHGRSALSYSEGIRNTAVRIRNSIVESSLMQVKSKHKMAREFNPYTYNVYYSKDGELQKQLNNNLLSDILAEMYLMAAEKAFYGEAVLGYPVPLVFEQTRLAHQDNTNYYTLLKSKDSDFEVLLQRLGSLKFIVTVNVNFQNGPHQPTDTDTADCKHFVYLPQLCPGIFV